MTLLDTPAVGAARAGAAGAAGATDPARPSHPGRRAALVGGLTLGLLVVVVAVHLDQGRSGVSLGDALRVVQGEAGEQVRAVVLGSRLPRLFAGLLVGAALAVSGVLLQSVTRNPMAEPGTTGVAGGAFLAVVLVRVLELPVGPLAGGGVAFVGGALAAAAVLVAAAGGASPSRLILAGMALHLTFVSATAALLLLFEQEVGGLFLWGQGALVQGGFDRVGNMAPVVVLGLAAAWLLGARLDVLDLGDSVAASLGVRPAPTRLVATVVAVALVAAAVAVAGPLAFVGLLAPHAARGLGVTGHRRLIACTVLGGPVLVLLADIVAQLLRGPEGLITELPAGVVTALLGAPLLVLVARRIPSGVGGGAPTMTERLRLPFGLVVPAVIAGLAVLVLAGLARGDLSLPLADVVGALAGGGDELTRRVVLDLRLPRILVAALAGAALAASGAALQAVTRNPLADPALLGVTGGAGVGALGLLFVVPDPPVVLLPVAAFAGAAVVLTLVLAASWRGGLAPDRLALVGVGAAAFTAAVTDLLVVRQQLRLSQALSWLAGSTYARGLDDVRLLALWPLLLVPVLWLMGRHLDLLGVGDDGARGLGLSVEGARLLGLLVGCLLAAAAVASVGTVGFVGLLGPHLARPFSGPLHRRLVPLAALGGATLVVLADLLGRTLLAPREVPAGLLVSLIGAPFFVLLLWRTRGHAG